MQTEDRFALITAERNANFYLLANDARARYLANGFVVRAKVPVVGGEWVNLFQVILIF